MSKLLFKLEILRAYFKKNYLYVLAGIFVGVSLYLWKDSILIIKDLSVFNKKYIGISGLYTTNNLPDEINKQLTYGLTEITENEKPQNSPLVESIIIENNNQDFIITLKPNFRWHNGDKLNAQDILFKDNSIKTKVVDNYKLQIHTDKPFAPLTALLSQPLYKKNLIGLGNYRVRNITYQDGYVKRLDLVSKNKFEPQLVYRFYQNDKDLLTAYKLGEIDETNTSVLSQDIKSWHKTQISQKIVTNKKYSAIFLNTEKISNKQTRQALAYATPKTKDKNERCLGPISTNSWAYNPSIKEYNYNQTRAKELFEEGTKIEQIKLLVIQPELLDIADNIKNSWIASLGIKVEISFQNTANFQDFDAILAYGGIPADPDQYSFWHSTQTNNNLTRLNNSRIDKLLEEGRTTFDTQKRKEIYNDFQKYLLEECPAIFLSYPTIYTVTRLK